MEEELIKNQERLKPQEEKQEVRSSHVFDECTCVCICIDARLPHG